MIILLKKWTERPTVVRGSRGGLLLENAIAYDRLETHFYGLGMGADALIAHPGEMKQPLLLCY